MLQSVVSFSHVHMFIFCYFHFVFPFIYWFQTFTKCVHIKLMWIRPCFIPSLLDCFLFASISQKKDLDCNEIAMLVVLKFHTIALSCCYYLWLHPQCVLSLFQPATILHLFLVHIFGLLKTIIEICLSGKKEANFIS